MAEKTLPIPERIFDVLAQYRTQQIELENANRLMGEKLGQWLEGKLGEETTLKQFRLDEQNLFDRVVRAKADLKRVHDQMDIAIRNYSFDRSVTRAHSA